MAVLMWVERPSSGSGQRAGSPVYSGRPGVVPMPGGVVLPAAPVPRIRPRPARTRPDRRRPAGLVAAPVPSPSAVACERVFRRRRFVALLTVGVVSALTVIGLAMLRTAAVDDGVPDGTAVVQVQSGETLWEVAQRVAPEGSPQAVVERIRELNDMRGSTVHPGQPLIVPAGD